MDLIDQLADECVYKAIDRQDPYNLNDLAFDIFTHPRFPGGYTESEVLDMCLEMFNGMEDILEMAYSINLFREHE